jgi:hypothetical protein
MRVAICKTQDPEAAIYLSYAQRSGQIPYIDKMEDGRESWYFMDVLNGGQVHRASDANFRRIPDGLYIFKDGTLYYEEYV